MKIGTCKYYGTQNDMDQLGVAIALGCAEFFRDHAKKQGNAQRAAWCDKRISELEREYKALIEIGDREYTARNKKKSRRGK